MTADLAELPLPSTVPVIKRWRVEMADKTTRTIEARGFRVEHGALILLLPLGCAAAHAPEVWRSIEQDEVLGREPIKLPGGRVVRVHYAPIATKFRGAAK